MPAAALHMLGNYSYNRKQYDDAERYWSDALALVKTEAAKRRLEQNVNQARRARANAP